ncbi:group 1 glycosyl transferase [Candidatus Desulfofervidus auxilii]|uniref:Group 1 glycosyl transferase n=1 Tax=Desulfofervidus auxilii TaxID=1621989 RepID=A0A7U4QIY5_DESA2|nr:glycosyltransferase family 4 protein [Candidatus Desulfofervidus auxilii]AMM40213.1 group 1 glycosyl transferase [Candidatus Desulfofervidus auxilii]CAD7772045.1 N-acetyl-alpha-D-glucosaminyl L-malate synthase [Candidatus Methanoperedenaceae archaeon GB37]
MKFKTDIIFWANINPNKRGSFEDFISKLSKECKKEGIKIIFVLGNDICSIVKKQFLENFVQYDLISSKSSNFLKQVRNMVTKYKPKIIHFNFTPFCHPAIIYCKKIVKTKIIFTDHDSRERIGQDSSIYNYFKLLRRRFYAYFVDKFVAVSDYIKNNIVNESLTEKDKNKVVLIYNGVDVDRFSPSKDKTKLKREFLGIKDTTNVVTFIGQLIYEKGADLLFDCAVSILREGLDVLFLFIGDGVLHNELKHKAKSLSKNIRFLGVRNDVDKLLKISDLLVLPSRWGEAFGLAIAEAMACEIPVIATKVGAIPELVNDETGILVPVEDVFSLKNSITFLLSHPEKRKLLGQVSRERVLRLFNIEKMVKKTISLYLELL